MLSNRSFREIRSGRCELLRPIDSRIRPFSTRSLTPTSLGCEFDGTLAQLVPLIFIPIHLQKPRDLKKHKACPVFDTKDQKLVLGRLKI